ncbi:MAG: transcription antitermination factor NusB [Oscillospiraceae bacterium]|nr:transcription antitermination factor NusB [Oscillospiraceae bacterium]
MTRTAAREVCVRIAYEMSYGAWDAEKLLETWFDPEYYATLGEEDELYKEYPDEKQKEYIARIVRGIAEHGTELDDYIEKYAHGWKFSRISRTAAAVMRLCMFEVLYIQDVPVAAAVNEAVELAKKYDTPETVSFVNGVLGSFVKGERPQ